MSVAAKQRVSEEEMRTTLREKLVLWLNGLLGYVDAQGKETFYTLGDVEEFQLPSDVDTYVLHPCLVSSVGLTVQAKEPAAER